MVVDLWGNNGGPDGNDNKTLKGFITLRAPLEGRRPNFAVGRVGDCNGLMPLQPCGRL